MPDTTFNRSPVADAPRREHIETLLSSYPDITDAEKEEILHYLKKGPPLDTVLLSTVDHFRPQLERFRRDHRRHFELGAKEYLIVAVLLAALVALFAFLWDSGLK